jgi:hypothetical protein
LGRIHKLRHYSNTESKRREQHRPPLLTHGIGVFSSASNARDSANDQPKNLDN